jgi:DNA-binding XRE family transcriptional regulator
MECARALHSDRESGDSRAGADWRGPHDDARQRTPRLAEEISLTIGRRLRQRRRELCATQKEIGRRAGVSYQQVQRYETGALRISAAMIWKLANALDVSVPYLFGL